jgi:hypothetical protein
MRRGSASLVILLAAVAAAGLDLTTFRQSYSRASRAGWYVSGSSDASGWIGASTWSCRLR